MTVEQTIEELKNCKKDIEWLYQPPQSRLQLPNADMDTIIKIFDKEIKILEALHINNEVKNLEVALFFLFKKRFFYTPLLSGTVKQVFWENKKLYQSFLLVIEALCYNNSKESVINNWLDFIEKFQNEVQLTEWKNENFNYSLKLYSSKYPVITDAFTFLSRSFLNWYQMV